MGFSDLGCYGGEIRTPHLDSLAASGLRFSQFYNCALCGPSRAALMTGLYPHQVGVFNWTGVLDDRCVTAFELFKAAGYATCAAGRLDMVTAENWRDPASVAKYVDHFLGSLGGQPGPGNYFKAIRDKPFYRDGEPFTLPDEAYKTDLITDFAVEFITTAAAGDRPFFLYLSHYAPHWPLHAKPEDIAKYRRLYRTLGWDALRAGRRQRLVEQGLVDDRCRLAPREPRIPAWQDAANKDWEAERMAVYAAQVDCLDQGVGRVLDALRRTQADRNTLVIFLSDNGASDQAWTKPLDEPGRTWLLDGTPTRLGNTPRVWPGPADTFVTAGPAWAAVSNAPFRGHKAASRRRASSGGRRSSRNPARSRTNSDTLSTSSPRAWTWRASRIRPSSMVEACNRRPARACCPSSAATNTQATGRCAGRPPVAERSAWGPGNWYHRKMARGNCTTWTGIAANRPTWRNTSPNVSGRWPDCLTSGDAATRRTTDMLRRHGQALP
jgi:arylsulfatase A-like enzyme